MSGYTSGNNAPTLMTQNANRKGNSSTRVASHSTGVTAQTNTKHGTSQPSGSQGAPAYAKATSNTNVGATAGRKQPVMVKTNCDYDGKIHNDGYLSSSYLK
jgi:hypothetical protein